MASMTAVAAVALDLPPQHVTPIDYVGFCGQSKIADFVVPEESACTKAEDFAIGRADDGDAERQFIVAPLFNYESYFGGCRPVTIIACIAGNCSDFSPCGLHKRISVGGPEMGLTIGR